MTKREFLPVEEQLARIKRGVVDFIGEEELAKKLAQSCKTGERLRIKFGIDPSSPDIHVGHTVVLRKLRTFQELGHLPIIIWGTATARVGDPTGKDKTRPQLTKEGVVENLATYKAQITKVIDIEDAEHRENGEWFDAMNFMDGVKLLSRMTVARAIERDSFENRMKKGLPVSLHEIVYPLMQGWDSVEIQADVEIGGSDQLFNLLVGRDLQEQEGQDRQACLTMPIIEGLDGTQKMSKSLGNYIGIHDAPADMFGKVMSLPDKLMEKYYLLLTDVSETEVQSILAGHPRGAKARLGLEIVAWLHGSDAALEAADEFDRVFKQKQKPTDIPEFEMPGEEMVEGQIYVTRAAQLAGLCQTSSEARRLIQGGGFRVDDVQIKDPKTMLGKGRFLLQAGKRRFSYVTLPILFFFVLLLSCSTDEEARQAEWQPYPANPSEGLAAKRARAVSARDGLAKNLMKELKAAMAKGGPREGVQVCNEKAPIVLKGLNTKGVRIGRTSFKLRNPANKPPDWAKGFVDRRVDEPVLLVDKQERLHALYPIRLKAQCVACHGTAEQIPDAVKSILAKRYPHDQALGFAPDDLRGWFWIEVD